MVEQPSSRRRLRRSLVLFGSLGVLAAAAVVAVLVPFVLSPQAAPHARVRALRAAPTTVLRFFEAKASLHPLPGSLLRFPAAGRVARIAAAGAALADGDVAASLEGQSSKSLLEKLASQRERLAFARQMAEGMHQAGNLAEEERQSSKVESRQIQVEKTLAELKQVAVVALGPGIVDQALAGVGQDIDAGSPAIRLRGSGLRASFALTRPQMASARKLPFCLLDIDGDVVDCNLREGADEAHVDVDVALGAVPPSLLDKPAKLARARYEAAVMVPAAVVLHSGNHDEVWLVSPQSRLEARAVTVAERDASVAVVVQGLDPDDRIVIEGPASLRPGQAVVVR